jgi:hypothetical protein
LIPFYVVPGPVALRLDGVVIDSQEVGRQQRRFKVAVGYIMYTRYIDVALGGAEDVFLAVLKLCDVVRVVEVIFNDQPGGRLLEALVPVKHLLHIEHLPLGVKVLEHLAHVARLPVAISCICQQKFVDINHGHPTALVPILVRAMQEGLLLWMPQEIPLMQVDYACVYKGLQLCSRIIHRLVIVQVKVLHTCK